MRLLDDRGDVYALGLAADQSTVRRLERDVALSTRMVSQSPIGLAVLDTRSAVRVGQPGAGADQRRPRGGAHRPDGPRGPAVLDVDAMEAAARQVLATGVPLIDQHTVGRTPADPDEDHAWSVSLLPAGGRPGTVLGVAVSVVDVTERHRAAIEAEAARRRLAVIADASARIGTTLELDRTARELADVAVPELADIARRRPAGRGGGGPPQRSRSHGARVDPRPGRPGRRTPSEAPRRGRPARDRSPDTMPTGWSPSAYAPGRPVMVRAGGGRGSARVSPATPDAAVLLAPGGRPLVSGRAADRARRGARRPGPQAHPQSAAVRRRRPRCSPGSWPPARPCRSTTPAGTRTPATPPSPSSAACCPATRR